jgi:hypothetical protein
VVVLFFSASQTKRPGYILTGVIALGVLTARMLDRAFADPAGRTARLVLQSTLAVSLISVVAGGVLTLDQIAPGGLQQLAGFHSKEFARLRAGLPLLIACLLAVTAAALVARLWGDLRLALAAFLLLPLLMLTVGFGTLARYADASSSRSLARALAPVPGPTVVACLECFPLGLPFYLGRAVTYVTDHGRALTSNYIRFRLKRATTWPESLVHLDDRDRWLGNQTEPVYLMTHATPRGLLEGIAAARGARVTEFHPGWWGALLPPRVAR